MSPVWQTSTKWFRLRTWASYDGIRGVSTRGVGRKGCRRFPSGHSLSNWRMNTGYHKSVGDDDDDVLPLAQFPLNLARGHKTG